MSHPHECLCIYRKARLFFHAEDVYRDDWHMPIPASSKAFLIKAMCLSTASAAGCEIMTAVVSRSYSPLFNALHDSSDCDDGRIAGVIVYVAKSYTTACLSVSGSTTRLYPPLSSAASRSVNESETSADREWYVFFSSPL